MPVTCEMQSVSSFLIGRNIKLDFLCKICNIYAEHAMSDSMAQIWVWFFFYEECENVKSEWDARSFLLNEDLENEVKRILEGELAIHNYKLLQIFLNIYVIYCLCPPKKSSCITNITLISPLSVSSALFCNWLILRCYVIGQFSQFAVLIKFYFTTVARV